MLLLTKLLDPLYDIVLSKQVLYTSFLNLICTFYFESHIIIRFYMLMYNA